MTFRIHGLDPAPFDPLFALDDGLLRARGALRCIADSDTGFPCRVSLEDARAGDELLLLPFEHQPAASPYRASGPIFVRRGARAPALARGEVPPYVSRRLMSLRAYDAAGMMLDADVHEGHAVGVALARMLADPRVDCVHLHNARRGCFSCVATRA